MADSKDNSPFSLTAMFGKVLSLFGMGDGPDMEKNRILREIKKSLKRNFKKYIRVNQNLIEPAFPKIFYEIYTVVGPAQALLASAATSGALKSLLIEMNLNERQKQLESQFQEEAIRLKSTQMPLPELAEELKKNLIEFLASFDAETVKRMDGLYNQILIFLDFINFNYYFLLKKFDSGLPERDFNYIPHWDTITGDYIVEDLKEFLEISQGMAAGITWDWVLDVLKQYKSLDVVNRDLWKKTTVNLASLKKSNLLQYTVSYFGREPNFKTLTRTPNERIVEPYLTILKTQAELTLTKILKERKTQKVQQLVKQIFGTESVARTKNYTEKANLVFGKKMMGGYLYIEPLNYLKAFLLDYYKRDVRELANLLLVKGQWYSPPLSQPFSESFYFLMELSDKLVIWDDSLAEDGEKGQKIKNYLMKFERDANAKVSLNQLLKEVNSQAKSFLLEAYNHLIVLAKTLKLGIDDLAKPKHDYITNWKALENSTQNDLKEWLPGIYKNIYYFVQLIQHFIKEGS